MFYTYRFNNDKCFMSVNNILLFKRTEKKYLLTKVQYNEIKERLKDFTVEDTYGQYSICNIYYDTDDYSLIRLSLERPVFKEKLRVRSYGIPSGDQEVFLEIKKKYKGIVYKRRIISTYSQIKDYFERGVRPNIPEDEERTFAEIDYFCRANQLKPKVFLAYERTALVAKDDKDFRITFDSNIRSRDYNVSFDCGDEGEPLLNEGEWLMELKVNKAIPMWLTGILSELKVYPISFSKYGRVYINTLKKKRGIV